MTDHAEIQKPSDIEVPAGSMWNQVPLIGSLIGVVCLGIVLGNAMGAHSERAFFSYLWAFEVGLSIALGALGWVLIEHLVRSGWSTVIRRIGETAMGTLPLFALLWIPIAAFGMKSLYPWVHETDEVLARKRWFLNLPFFHGRAIAYVVTWALLGYIFYSLSTRQDRATDEGQRNTLTKRMWMLSAPALVLWALTQSFQAVDWLMSLQPHWYSTIFGVYFFAGSISALFAFLVLTSLSLQSAGVLKTAITTEHFHDLGKYIYGFTVFWAYIAFSQFMLIWYANIPEETEFFIVRMHGGWAWISYLLPVLHFFAPFLYMLSRRVKRNRKLLALAAIWILGVEMLDLYWLIMPNYVHGGGHGPVLCPTWLDGAALLGVLGLFLAAFAFLLKRNKVVAINDPRLAESLVHENY